MRMAKQWSTKPSRVHVRLYILYEYETRLPHLPPLHHLAFQCATTRTRTHKLSTITHPLLPSTSKTPGYILYSNQCATRCPKRRESPFPPTLIHIECIYTHTPSVEGWVVALHCVTGTGCSHYRCSQNRAGSYRPKRFIILLDERRATIVMKILRINPNVRCSFSSQ